MSAKDVDTIPVREAGTRVAYGRDSLQFGDLRLPPGRGPFPVAIVIHGGCYVSTYATLHHTAAMAQALADAGVATWNIEYRRYDSPGGAWPGTFADVAMGADYVRALAKRYPLDTNRVVTIGHSAGGQLSLWLAGRRNIPANSPLFVKAPLPVAGVVSLGPITDMREYYGRERQVCGNPAIESVLGGVPDSVPDRVRAVSPVEVLPLRVPTVLVAGALDGIALRPSLDAYAKAARAKGDSVVIVTTEGEGHYEAIAPARMAGKAAIDAVKRILGVHP